MSKPAEGAQGEALFGAGNWSGAPVLTKASMSLKKNKAAVMEDDEVDDFDWTCQGCLVSHLMTVVLCDTL